MSLHVNLPGGFGVLPAFVSDMWGSKISGATHGITIGVWALSTLIGVPIFTSVVASHSSKSVTGVVVPSVEGYAINASWLACLPAIGVLAVLALNDDLRDRILRAAQPGAVRVRLPRGRVLVLVRALTMFPSEAYLAAVRYHGLMLPCYRALMVPCYRALMAPCYRALMVPCYRALMAPCYRALMVPCYRALTVPCPVLSTAGSSVVSRGTRAGVAHLLAEQSQR